MDGPAYRLGAVRETFEESGILLAHGVGAGEEGRLVEVEEGAMLKGRKEVHGRKVEFGKWLESVGGRADVG